MSRQNDEIINYIIPRNNRELQRDFKLMCADPDYIIPRNNRELQLYSVPGLVDHHYIIPRNNRELQQKYECM